MKTISAFLLVSTVLFSTQLVAQAAPLGRVCYNPNSGSIASYSRRCPSGTLELSASRIQQMAKIKGPQGPRGEQGLQGAKGLTGAKGETGLGAFDAIPSGKTITGVIGGTMTTAQAIAGDVAAWSRSESITGVLPTSLSNASVIVAYNSLFTQCNASAPNRGRYNCMDTEDSNSSVNSLCTGSVENPTAPAGKVCIYTYALSNAYNVAGKASSNGRYGFELTWISVPSESATTDIRAVWAYTAN